MPEKLTLESAIISIPVEIEDKKDPSKVTDFVLNFDASDDVLMHATERMDATQRKLNELQRQYHDLIAKGKDMDDADYPTAIAAINEGLRIQFDSDYGDGTYNALQAAGGGSSFVNMLGLYQQATEYVGIVLNRRIAKVQRKSANKKAKYFNKHRR
jgi:hypothetical protein